MRLSISGAADRRQGRRRQTMRKLILKMSVSIDGFVGGPNGEIDWIFKSMSDEGAAWTIEKISQAGVHAMGSRTFRDMAAYWPTSTEPFAAPMNEIPKVVFSRGDLQRSESTRALADARAQSAGAPTRSVAAAQSWTDARVVKGDLTEEIARLKQEPGKDIVAHGGASFAQSLVQRNLVDEYWLLTHPVALGRGLPLFAKLPAPLDLELLDCRTFPRGAVARVYRTR
jgi:dihydrofolate reductase